MKHKTPATVYLRSRLAVNQMQLRALMVLGDDPVTINRIEGDQVYYTFQGKDHIVKYTTYGFKVAGQCAYFSDVGLPSGSLVGGNAKKFLAAIANI